MIGDIWNFYAINFSQHLLARPNVFVLVADFKKSRHATSKLAILLNPHDSVARPKGLLVLYCAFLLKKQYSGLKDCRVLEYDTEQQVSG